MTVKALKIAEKQKNKNLKKKLRKKLKRNGASASEISESESTNNEIVRVEIDYVPETIEAISGSTEFLAIMEKFKFVEPSKHNEQTESAEDNEPALSEVPRKAKAFTEDDEEENDDEPTTKVSKKKLKKLSRLSVAELKQLVSRPDVVEMHDVTASDPKLLIILKAIRNSVPVPRHWCFKRKYLQGKRGIEKPPFQLPDFIKATGIMEMRQALSEKEDEKSLKTKMKEKVRPKMGKINLNYQDLSDAFFKHQTKPDLTIHGDLYYEGKEFEKRHKQKKPGILLDSLKEALGMPMGYGSEKCPPPWLVAMQRYGPPPSYPNLKIQGLNAPIPDGCSFGYHPGGWGKPPVDEIGRPIYGNVFQPGNDDIGAYQLDDIDKVPWEISFNKNGIHDDDDDDDDDEEDEDEEEGEEPEVETLPSAEMPADEGLATPSGMLSVATTFFETPESIELRKKRIETAMDEGDEAPALFTVLPEKNVSLGSALLGSSHIYDMAALKSAKSTKVEGVQVALNPDELELDASAMEAKYEQTIKKQNEESQPSNYEDFSEMVVEHQAKQNQKKRKKTQRPEDGKAKKFKF